MYILNENLSIPIFFIILATLHYEPLHSASVSSSIPFIPISSVTCRLFEGQHRQVAHHGSRDARHPHERYLKIISLSFSQIQRNLSIAPSRSRKLNSFNFRICCLFFRQCLRFFLLWLSPMFFVVLLFILFECCANIAPIWAIQLHYMIVLASQWVSRPPLSYYK